MAACAGAYLWGVIRTGVRWPAWRTVSFLSGLGVILLALQSGIDTYDQRLLSVHMLQHMLLLLAAPLLLLAGRPLTLALRSLPRVRGRELARLLVALRPLANPYFALGAFSAVLLVSHLRPVYGATLAHPSLHEAEHGLFLLAGILLWSPLLDADPVSSRRLSGLGRLVYLLAAMPPMALLGAYLNRATSIVYPAYAAPARAVRVSAVADQQQAGALMWVGGSCLIVLVGLWAAMSAMDAEERRQDSRERRDLAAGVAENMSGGSPR
jgi:putative copper resistance protein D